MSNISGAIRCAASLAAATLLGAVPLQSAAAPTANWSIADLGAEFKPADINDHGVVPTPQAMQTHPPVAVLMRMESLPP